LPNASEYRKIWRKIGPLTNPIAFGSLEKLKLTHYRIHARTQGIGFDERHGAIKFPLLSKGISKGSLRTSSRGLDTVSPRKGAEARKDSRAEVFLIHTIRKFVCSSAAEVS
jgi:hypothetical protein